MTDLDQGGTPTQKTRVYLGPSLGWVDQQVLPERRIDGSGVIEIDPGDSVVLLAADGPTRLNLPDVRAWNRQTANQPATGFARAIWIKDFAGRATTFNIVIFPFGSQLIDGTFQSLQLSSNYQTITFYPLDDESGWYTVIQSAGGTGGGGVTLLNATAPLSGTIVGNVLNINIVYDSNFALAGGQLALAFAPPGTVLGNASLTPDEPIATPLTNIIDRAIGNSQGMILYRSASAWVALPAGTSGQFLSTGGTSSPPAWQTVVPGGTGNVSNSGSPSNGQWARWTDPTHIEGVDSSATGFQPLDGDLTALSALNGTNTIYYRSAIDTWSAVTIGANLTFTGGTLSATGGSGGVPEAPTDGHQYLRQGSSGGSWVDNALVNQPADGDLTALAGLTGTNTIYYRSGTSTWTAVTIGSGLSFGGGTLSATAISDGDKGDIVVSGGGTTWNIDTNAVDTTKLADMPQGTVIGRPGGAGTGDPSYITPTQVLDVIGTTQGSVLYRSGSAWTALAPGTSGQVLTTNGAGNNPAWATASAGASLTISDTPPGSPSQGNLWWESDTGKLYVSYQDPGGPPPQWVGVAASSTAVPFPTTQTFTSGSGTYTTPAGCRRIEVHAWGAGGAGGGSILNGATTLSAGSGGGGGGYLFAMLNSPSPTYSYAVGAGGTGQVGAGGLPGGQTTFGGLSANGGAGGGTPPAATTVGPNSAPGGAGGGAGGPGTVFGVAGSPGQLGDWAQGVAAMGGVGGSGGFGGGGGRGTNVSGGSVGQVPGGGGSGAAGNVNEAAKAGASGADGRIVVIEYYG